MIETTTDKRIQYKLSYKGKNVSLTYFSSKKNEKVMLQGRDSLLTQILISSINTKTSNADNIDSIMSNYYEVDIDSNFIDNYISQTLSGFPDDYPKEILILIRQSVLNLNYYFESDDYSFYAFPILKALEGHIKYLIYKSTGMSISQFTVFNKDKNTNVYTLARPVNDERYKNWIEDCYNYFTVERNRMFHYDLFDGITSTRIIENKEEVDDIILHSISLIQNNREKSDG